MRPSFTTALWVGVAVLDAVMSSAPAQEQDAITVNECYESSALEAQFASGNMQKIITADQFVKSAEGSWKLSAIDIYVNRQNSDGFLIRHSDCTPQTASKSAAHNTVVPLIRFTGSMILDNSDPESFNRIAGSYKDDQALAHCAKLNQPDCGSYNQYLISQKRKNVGPMFQAHMLIVKDGKYVDAGVLTISSEATDHHDGGLLTTFKSGATLLKMKLTNVQYTETPK